MPVCPACDKETAGNFCTDCGARLVKRQSKQQDNGNSPVRGPGDSPTPQPSNPPVAMSGFACMIDNCFIKNSRRRLPMISASSSGQSRLSVAVRKRPLNPSEQSSLDIINVTSLNSITVLEPKKALDGTPNIDPQKFLFDEVFDESDGNIEVYKRTAGRLIDFVYDGGFCSCFAYGQTGSGKTYTMMGTNARERGLYLQAADEIFRRLEPNLEVAVSFFEIYASKLYDLLNAKEQIYAREDENQKVHIRGLTEHKVSNSTSIMNLVKKGLEGRSSSTTTMNDESSRSHAIMEIKLKLSSGKLIGKLSVIDLAGSERASVGHAGDKQIQMEGAEINKSLLALKECIRALDQGARHIPFRQSELTQILKESFIGDNGHTVMIANISPTGESCAETLNTLRYAYRVKELKSDEDAKNPTVAGGNLIKNIHGSIISSNKETPRCSGCTKEFRNLATLEAHKESCELVTTTCEYCGTSYKRRDELKHTKSCTKLPVTCKQCKDKVPRDALKKHQQYDCPMAETSCLFCRVKLLKSDLESHKNTCEQRMVDCDECGARVKQSQMVAHKRTCKKTKRSSEGSVQTAPPSQMPPPVSSPTAKSRKEPKVTELKASTEFLAHNPPAPAPVKKERPAAYSQLQSRVIDDDNEEPPQPVTPSPPVGKKPSLPPAISSCPMRELGCDITDGSCGPDSHLLLLVSTVQSQQRSISTLTQRVKSLEAINEALRRSHPAPSNGSKLR
eukprot:TRINITY_DN5344_c0_g2_i1.p1 TRINITY_DN5344_c0_g2~~TRINITY_DN5344_c0_g2_i1.p1  ORF type:complete len:732 (+),score=129.02 TRINITY_DN5344_c0_g2_i1:90-2285(+)